MRWDKLEKLEGVINRVANKNRIKPEQVKAIIEHVFISLRNSLRNPSLPKILISNFGTFKPNLTIVTNKIKRIEEDLASGTLSEKKRVVFEESLKSLKEAEKRLLNERL